MSFQRATEPELQGYTLQLMRRLEHGTATRADGRPARAPSGAAKWTRTEIAGSAGIDKGRVTQIFGGAPAGRKVQDGIAGILGLSPDQLHTAAREWARENPHLLVAPVTVAVVRPDRYPNRARAAAAARTLGIGEVAIRNIEGLSLKDGVADLEAWEWLQDMKSEERHLSRGARPSGEPAPPPEPRPSARDRIAAVKSRRR